MNLQGLGLMHSGDLVAADTGNHVRIGLPAQVPGCDVRKILLLLADDKALAVLLLP